ncbi:CASP-like protein 2B1 [Andrographis paniculata]|uniref:CASP-like protein 2B1 n=1 Tax=Andrographis paniculata TaxID=175694 RepID=UPI0021E88E42|nr:CASP-like protein 2B1 [Andrographis paniculata]
MSYLGVGMSPGNVPVYHGSGSLVDRRVRLAELLLRCAVIALAVASAALIGSDTQVKEIFSVQKRAKFTDMKALILLVVSNGVAGAYSAVQVVRCVMSMVKGTVLFSKPLAWAIFSADQAVAYLTVAAVAAAAQSAVFAKVGEADMQWMKICGMYAKFCNQVGEGIAGAVLLSLAAVTLSGVSAFSLFRLYGDCKKKIWGNNGK